MINGCDVLRFEEINFSWLIDQFIRKKQDEWNEFVETEFHNAEQKYDLDGRDYYAC
jgi:hypothetical protein